jgi:diadenosine tetraphosphate (Ap4A) HIT family hydrolase
MATIHELVEACQKGSSPLLIGKMRSGWAVMGSIQIVPGYCLLLPDPVVPSLNHLTGDARQDYLKDLARLGDAVLKATDAVRINYEILGNVEQVLHGHVAPRYEDEEHPMKLQPIFMHDWEKAPKYDLSVHGDLKEQIREALLKLQEVDLKH